MVGWETRWDKDKIGNRTANKTLLHLVMGKHQDPLNINNSKVSHIPKKRNLKEVIRKKC